MSHPIPAIEGAAFRRGLKPLLALLFVALWMAFGPIRATESLLTEGEVIELPKFEVVDTRVLPPPEKWSYTEIPGFEILSNVSARETKRFVQDFHLLQNALQVMMPGLTHRHVPLPTKLILCGRGNAFDQFLTAHQRSESNSWNSLFFEDAEHAAIVVDFALSELRIDVDTVEDSNAYRAFYHQYFRFLIRRTVGNAPPAWVEEGLVQMLAATEFNRRWIVFAELTGSDPSMMKTGDFRARLQRRALLPMDVLFAPTAPEHDRAVWSAQAYAFVHLCLYGEKKRYQASFLKFLERAAREPVTEQLFEECFKMNYKKMLLQLRGYTQFTLHTSVRFRGKKGQKLPAPPPVELHDASDATVGRIKGETLRLAGHDEAARNSLIAPYIRGERDPRLLAALGLNERLAGRDERARKFLEAAAKAKVERARAYLELGRLRYEEALAKPAGPDGQLDAAQVEVVLAPLLAARKQRPPMAAVYSLMADVWTRSAVPPTEDNFKMIVEGVQIFYRDPRLVDRAIQVGVRAGELQAARVLAEHGVTIAGSSAAREHFAEIAASLPVPAPSSAASTPGPETTHSSPPSP